MLTIKYIVCSDYVARQSFWKLNKSQSTHQSNVILIPNQPQLCDQSLKPSITYDSEVKDGQNLASLANPPMFPVNRVIIREMDPRKGSWLTSVQEGHEVHQAENRHESSINLLPKFSLLFFGELVWW